VLDANSGSDWRTREGVERLLLGEVFVELLLAVVSREADCGLLHAFRAYPSRKRHSWAHRDARRP
jgi:hypothetical protein